jgi:hypothetical protein
MSVVGQPRIDNRRREFMIGFASSISYFVGLLLLPSIFFLNPFVLLVLGWFAIFVVVAALIFGVPLGLMGQAIAHRFSHRWVGLLVFFGVGSLTAYLAFALYALAAIDRFEPLSALGPKSGSGVALVIGLAGLCTLAGWATARKYGTPAEYDDALEGLDFAELAELIRTARETDH